MDYDARTQEITRLIEHMITNQPRSLQRTIGPSEIGNPCDHCLAARLAGWNKHEVETPWVTVIGTSVHAWMEEHFQQAEAQARTEGRSDWLTEARVMVGLIGGKEIWGSTDLIDVQGRMTVDWKIVGDSSLAKYKAGPSQVYRTQAHLYAKGWNDAGTPIDEVSIYFLPRNKQMRYGFWWHEPYQPQIAAAALERANRLQISLDAIEQAAGIDVRDKWITNLPRDSGCWDCKRYPDTPPPTDPLGLGLTAAQPNSNDKHNNKQEGQENERRI